MSGRREASAIPTDIASERKFCPFERLPTPGALNSIFAQTPVCFRLVGYTEVIQKRAVGNEGRPSNGHAAIREHCNHPECSSSLGFGAVS
jgi:hypothetical protein